MDHADGTDEDLVPVRALHRLRERHLVPGSVDDALRGVVSPGGEVEEVDAVRGKDAREAHRVLRPPRRLVRERLLQPVRRRDAARAVSEAEQRQHCAALQKTHRKKSGMVGGMTARTASTISSGNRIRFSKLPPYSSVRRLLCGLKNELMRYPCAP